MDRFRKYLVPLTAALIIVLCVGAGALERLDTWTQDQVFQNPGTPMGDLVIIGIDEKALAEFGPYNTWDRNIMAAVLEALAADPEKKPAVTAVDVLYAGETDPAADARLAAAARNLGSVVTACLAEFGQTIVWEDGRALSVENGVLTGMIKPYGALGEAALSGHINAMCDVDGILRHGLWYVDDGEERTYSMAAEAARLYAKQRGLVLRMPEKSFFYIPYTTKPGGYYDGISAADVISGRVPSDYWAGKIVLVGPYAAALQDAYFTSVDRGEQMYGVEFQANMIQCLLEGNTKTEVQDGVQLGILFAACAVLTAVFLRLQISRGAVWLAAILALSIVLTIVLNWLGFITHPLWLPFGAAAAYAASSCIHYLTALQEKQALELEKKRLDTELDLAARIQANFLPQDFPAFPERTEFDLYASMVPAKEVGGDFYDFFLIDEDHLGMVMADVSGKGIPAALFMMTAMTLTHYAALREKSPAAALKEVNDRICLRNPEGMFVTVWLGILELSTGKLTTANAGHEYPAMKSADGSFALVKDRHGIMIGYIEGISYRDQEFMLEPGAKVFVYTDGVPEATDAQGELFGTERMTEALRRREDASPREVLAAVNEAVGSFVGDAPQFDDLTMLCLQYNGRQQKTDG